MELSATWDPEDVDFKKTAKLHWVINDPNFNFELQMVEYDHLINKPKIEEDDNMKDLV